MNYRDSSNELKGCVNDAKSVRDILVTNGDESPNFDVMLLTDCDKSISQKDLKDNVIALFQDDVDICLFYFSGHGYTDVTGGHLTTSDHIEGNDGLSFHDLLSIASKSKARNKVLILDCCYSGALGEIGLFDDFSIIGEGMIILAACRKEQTACELCGQGMFTKLLLEALRGEMDLFGKVTSGDVYAYIDKALSPWDQRPVFKANVISFVPLRRNNPSISLEDLHQLIGCFKHPEDVYHLDPTYEQSSEISNEEHVAIFRRLQKCNHVGLVCPLDEEHMYYAAMHSKGCRLTPYGRCYWRLLSGRQA